MKNITTHTGTIRLIERLPQSANGNPRFLLGIMDSPDNYGSGLGWTFRTGVDSAHGYEVQDYIDTDKQVTVEIGTHYGHATLNAIHRV